MVTFALVHYFGFYGTFSRCIFSICLYLEVNGMLARPYFERAC